MERDEQQISIIKYDFHLRFLLDNNPPIILTDEFSKF